MATENSAATCIVSMFGGIKEMLIYRHCLQGVRFWHQQILTIQYCNLTGLAMMVLKNACRKLLGLSQNMMDEPRGVSSRKVQQCLFQIHFLDKYNSVAALYLLCLYV